MEMLESLQMCLFKSEYRRKFNYSLFVLSCFVILGTTCSLVIAECQDSAGCGGNGKCINETCSCFDGWQGPQCQYCGGKVRLGASTGTIHDGLGNYSIGIKCSWLIVTPNKTITFHLEEFATECGWDYLYIFDGDSVDSTLLAVFSGLMYKDNYSIKKIPEVVAHSGSALVHFFSDDAYNMSGFNVTYRLNGCPSNVSGTNCSGNGVCLDGGCTCYGGWDGAACHLKKCPNNCGNTEGRGRCDLSGCVCNNGFKGDDCSQLTDNGFWETTNPQNFVPPGSASHGATVWRDSLYIVAGERYSKGKILYTYDFNGNMWETPHFSEEPSPRYAHSTVLYGDKIFIYGGILGNRGPTSELWAFDISAKIWENVTVKAEACNGSYLLCGPLKVAGHTATVVSNENNKKADRMVVIFGYSPYLGFLNTVQEYYFGTREWHIVNARGFPVKGGYGHTASWDPYTSKIYVYGGDISKSQSAQILSKTLYSYDPYLQVWTLLSDAPSARFLHSATFVSPGLMLVFGGNTHNDTLQSFGAKCYSSELLAYDVECDTWHILSVPKDMKSDLSRYGHSAVIFEGSLYIYGGFNGQMLSDILKYTPGSCTALKNQSSCLTVKPGRKCVWDTRYGRCVSIDKIAKTLHEGVIDRCPEPNRSYKTQTILQKKELCEKIHDCSSCVQTTSQCVWCGNGNCTYGTECRDEMFIKKLDECKSDSTPFCNELHTCTACGSQPFCRWKYDDPPKCVALPPTTNISESTDQPQCQKVCSEYTSCLSCTQEECIWCQNEGRCIDKNAYICSFPYGQCREWTTVGNKCRSHGNEEKSQCSFYLTCTQCRDDPACGWCDDGSKTGLGKCMPGGSSGPTLHTQSLPSTTCLPDRWHFTTCPVCQCNGHASCTGNTSICNGCKNLTVGAHCEKCIAGYWGSPVYGGTCQPCECNGHATQCHHETGKCFCTTKGLVGDHCEKCDHFNRYTGDPSNKGSCYYELIIDYQFTFNLSKKEDRHYNQINFRNSPTKPDIDAEFMITCSVLAKVNVTVKKANSKEEKPLFTARNCTNFKNRFSKSEFNFGTEDNVTLTTFYVYVYDFQSPLWIQISFAQHPKFNIQQFYDVLTRFYY